MFGYLHEFKFLVELGILVVVTCHTGFTLWDRRNKVTQEALGSTRTMFSAEVSALRNDLELRRRRVDDSMEALKTRMADTPTRDDLTRLHAVIDDVSQLANELRGTVHALQNTMQMINQHLLDQKHA